MIKAINPAANAGLLSGAQLAAKLRGEEYTPVDDLYDHMIGVVSYVTFPTPGNDWIIIVIHDREWYVQSNLISSQTGLGYRIDEDTVVDNSGRSTTLQHNSLEKAFTTTVQRWLGLIAS